MYDHIGLRVKNVDASVHFYEAALQGLGHVVCSRDGNGAGLGPKDVDTAQIYDCFTYMVLTQLEDYGFCKKGEGGAFVADGKTKPGGSLPMNTSGGLLSETGMPGMQLIVNLFDGPILHAAVDRKPEPGSNVAGGRSGAELPRRLRGGAARECQGGAREKNRCNNRG